DSYRPAGAQHWCCGSLLVRARCAARGVYSFSSLEHHAEHEVVTFDLKIAQAGLPGQGMQFADGESCAAGLWSVVTSDLASDQGVGQKFRRPNRGPISAQIGDNIADARKFLNTPQNGNGVVPIKMMQC